MGARVRFNAECDLLLLEQAVACSVYQQQGGRGWKQVANNLIDLHEKFQYITPRCARERTHLLVTKYAAELGQTITSSACSETERGERAILLNQLLHIKQNERNSCKADEGSRSSHDLPDNIQPKVEFPESAQSMDSFSDNGQQEHLDGSEDYEVFHADIPNGVLYKSTTSSRSPRGQKRPATSSPKQSDGKEDYLIQLVSSLEETSRKHARLLGEELELRRRELELRAQRLQMEMAERTAMVDLIKALVHKN
ncbi:hypothetical protein ElyMa_000855800 [Elysia marginata]|uniref:Myb/SANT-like DNA-binding domain-containing protein n=1 Tax=Elysia marginata TaxID=1093978 RepID=A0AAV4H2V6_9GAST|nr:hypothetical protein ElyMa_000855800 [Elysia marginata]